MLHHCQERALRPVPQRMSFLVEQAEKPVPKQVIENGARWEFKWAVGNRRWDLVRGAPAAVKVTKQALLKNEKSRGDVAKAFVGL